LEHFSEEENPELICWEEAKEGSFAERLPDVGYEAFFEQLKLFCLLSACKLGRCFL
jgi:hypothetical protein